MLCNALNRNNPLLPFIASQARQCRLFTSSGAAAAVKITAERSNASMPPVSQQPYLKPIQQMTPEYDVFIIGGGITGSALLYELAHFTDLKSIGLADKGSDFALIASGATNNSQTIHCGDIETNYSLEKAKMVKMQADMMRNYGSKLSEEIRDKCIYKMQKMVIGVGEAECDQIEKRYALLKEVFPKMQLATKSKLRKVEPNVIRKSTYCDRHESVNGLLIENEHSAVNYYNLTHSFIQQAKDAGKTPGRRIDINVNTEVKNITEDEKGTYTIHTQQGQIRSKFVVVSACGYSLLFAQKLGYGLYYGCLPVAGSFYFAKTPVLNGKVYTIQNPKLPFAAVHGDPDVHAVGLTRFGPTALPLPLLERHNRKSFRDFLRVSNIDLKLLATFMHLFRDPVMLKFALRNTMFELPYVGPRLFLSDAQKIIPGLTIDDLVYAEGYGAVRPQLVDKKNFKLIMGEGKISGNNIIFNVTPSPGGTTCLGNAEKDMRSICKTLGANINETKLKKILYEGEYPIDTSN